MHEAARGFVASVVTGEQYASVVEVGGRWINGGVRDLIIRTGAYTSLDLHPGPDVDVVADIRDWTAPEPVALVVCCEVLEHADDPEGVVKSCLAQLAPGGRIIVTCAGPDREPHSGYDGGPVRAGEHYGNVEPGDLGRWLGELEGLRLEYHSHLGDLYATGTVPGGPA